MKKFPKTTSEIVKAMTLNEMEKALEQEKRTKMNLMMLIAAGSIILILTVGLVYISYTKTQINKEIDKLQVINVKLMEENNNLMEENKKLKEQFNHSVMSEPVSDIIYHHIQTGDNFAVLSKQYYGTEKYAAQIAKINGLSKTTRLHIGQVLQIPKQPDPSW
ncbi:LysM peptidoglycan-binding domain-containing protein [Desulforamulus ferrireducens]|uniref:LysM domain-containing protein n=1 Tax=Desulforamulus ferrireducens TaxID=1833852 RepID=A0A1S6IYU1_9FIRM|nr:LysM domain-containing protein [Desulforamulus ferrireducens]AQS59943.1 hypothetical protein B0537_13155 [Desulforamulus ferrireducens]